jgi:hypothetical protein
MRIGIIGEGDTEYYSVPTLVAQLGHTVVGVHNLCGVGDDYPWEALFAKKIYPYVRSFAIKPLTSRPDRVVVVLDRESRSECCGGLAETARQLVAQELASENLRIPLSVILANRQFECWLLANVTALDGSPLLRGPISPLLGAAVDEKDVLGIIKANLKRGCGWDKPRYGKALAQKLDLADQAVLGRSRSLRKFVKEVGNQL